MRPPPSICIPEVDVRTAASMIMVEIDVTKWATIRPIDPNLARRPRNTSTRQLRRILRAASVMRPRFQFADGEGVQAIDFQRIDPFAGRLKLVERRDLRDRQRAAVGGLDPIAGSKLAGSGP